MIIGGKKINENAIVPTRGHKGEAGYDLYACIKDSITISPGKNVMVSTELTIAIPDRYFGAVFARSGLATKQGIRSANCVSVCVAPYRRVGGFGSAGV